MKSVVVSAFSASVSLHTARLEVESFLNAEIDVYEAQYCHVRVSQPALQVLTCDKYMVIMAVTIEYGKEISCQAKYT